MKKNIKSLLLMGLLAPMMSVSAFAAESLTQVPIDKFERGIQYYDLIGSLNKSNLGFFENLQEINIENKNEIKFHIFMKGNYYGVVSGDTLQDFAFLGLKSPDGKKIEYQIEHKGKKKSSISETNTGEKVQTIPLCNSDIKEKIKNPYDFSNSSDPQGHFVVCGLQDNYMQKFYVFLLPANLSQVGDWSVLVHDNGILEQIDEDNDATFINNDSMPFFHQAHETGSTVSVEIGRIKTPEDTGILSGEFNAIVNKAPSSSMFEVNLKRDGQIVDDASISLKTDFGTTLYFQENPNVPGNYVAKANIKTTQFLNELVEKRYLLTVESGDMTYYSWVKL